MTAGPVTSVLVATRDRPDLLEECLGSLLRTGLDGAEVIVLDQSADSRSERVVAGLGGEPRSLRHVRLAGPGKSRALNRGIELARGRRIALTDDDCVVADDWLSAMERECRDRAGDERAILAGRVLPGRHAPDGTPPPSCIVDPEPHDYSGRVGREVVYQNWCAPRRAFEEVGGFDERLGPGTPLHSAEDNDMAYRWLRAGYRVLYRPALVVWHHGWRRREELRDLKWSYGLGQGAFYAKHALRGDGHLAGRFARDTLRVGREAAGALVRGDAGGARAAASFLLGLWAGAARMSLLTLRP